MDLSIKGSKSLSSHNIVANVVRGSRLSQGALGMMGSDKGCLSHGTSRLKVYDLDFGWEKHGKS